MWYNYSSLKLKCQDFHFGTVTNNFVVNIYFNWDARLPVSHSQKHGKIKVDRNNEIVCSVQRQTARCSLWRRHSSVADLRNNSTLGSRWWIKQATLNRPRFRSTFKVSTWSEGSHQQRLSVRRWFCNIGDVDVQCIASADYKVFHLSRFYFTA